MVIAPVVYSKSCKPRSALCRFGWLCQRSRSLLACGLLEGEGGWHKPSLRCNGLTKLVYKVQSSDTAFGWISVKLERSHLFKLQRSARSVLKTKALKLGLVLPAATTLRQTKLLLQHGWTTAVAPFLPQATKIAASVASYSSRVRVSTLAC